MKYLSAADWKEYKSKVASIESGNNPLAKNPLSTASGLYQFIKSTWTGLGYNWSDIFDVAKQNEAFDKFTSANAAEMVKSKCAINYATLYGAHFLGVNGLLSVMRGSPTADISTVTTAAQRKANPTILKGTIKTFCDWLEKKTGDSVYLRRETKNAEAIPPVATEHGGSLMNWFNGLVGKTALQYLVNAIGALLVGKGIFNEADWSTIAGAIMVLLGAAPGIIAAATEKVMIGGKTVAVSNLTPATQIAVSKEINAK